MSGKTRCHYWNKNISMMMYLKPLTFKMRCKHHGIVNYQSKAEKSYMGELQSRIEWDRFMYKCRRVSILTSIPSLGYRSVRLMLRSWITNVLKSMICMSWEERSRYLYIYSNLEQRVMHISKYSKYIQHLLRIQMKLKHVWSSSYLTLDTRTIMKMLDKSSRCFKKLA